MEESKKQTAQVVLIKVFLITLIGVLAYFGYFAVMNGLGMPEGEVSPRVMFAVGFVAAVALIPVLEIKDGIKNDETQRILIGVTFAILFGLAGFRGCYDRFFNMIYAMLP